MEEIRIERIYTCQEVAGFLRVTPKTVRAWIKEGKVKAKQIGRAYQIPESELRRCMSLESV